MQLYEKSNIKLEDFKKYSTKKKVRRHFWSYQMKRLKEFDLYIDIVLIVYIQGVWK